MPTYLHVDMETGLRRLVILPEGYEPCFVCDGTGIVYDDLTGGVITCEECDGEGMIESVL
jgi:hypothetical protein